MRKIKDLTSLELLELMTIIEPLLPAILESEFVQSRIAHVVSQELLEANYEIEKAKTANDFSEGAVAKAVMTIHNEVAKSKARDIQAIVPMLLKSENSGRILEAVAFLCRVTKEEVGGWVGTKLMSTIKQIIEDINFADFLEPAEQLETNG